MRGKNTLLHPWRIPGILLNRLTWPVPFGLWLVNMIHQRVLRINAGVPFMVHFTS